MNLADLDTLSRDDLKAAVLRLQGLLDRSKATNRRKDDARASSEIRHRSEIEASHADLRVAEARTRDVHTTARDAARVHRLELAESAAHLATARQHAAGLEASRAALVSSEARQRAIFENAIDVAVVVTDPAGTVTDWNPGAERVMGWSAPAIVGGSAERIFTPEDRAAGRIEEEMRRALADGRAFDERWHMRQDGARFWASGELMPLYDEAGVHLGFVKILRDRTAEHLANVALQEAQERYRLVTKATNDAVRDWDLLTDQVVWSEAFQEAYEHAAADVEPTGT